MVKTQRVAKEIERRKLSISVAHCCLYGLATFKLLRLIYKDEFIKTSYVIANKREIVNTLGVDSNIFNLDSIMWKNNLFVQNTYYSLSLSTGGLRLPSF